MASNFAVDGIKLIAARLEAGVLVRSLFEKAIGLSTKAVL
jgi:hypothetical protein